MIFILDKSKNRHVMQSICVGKKKVTPSKVVCAGRNYAAHVQELNNEMPSSAVIFVKPNSAISDVLLTHAVDSIHYEAELSFLIVNNRLDAVGFGLDLTKREIQTQLKNKGLPWERAKAFDASAVFSEFVSLKEHDVTRLYLRLFINQELVQNGGVDLMLRKPQDLLVEAKSFMTFEDADILMTGTPSGVGQVKAGDIFRGQVICGDLVLIECEWTAQ
jgi:2-keto-4-pentenoate hydratase/2-oxohepta-3-ene-1,7-dioic acid hydratase in catechol pathway